jgi:hypothetical protein
MSQPKTPGQSGDDRWIAKIQDSSDLICYGATKDEALTKLRARVLKETDGRRGRKARIEGLTAVVYKKVKRHGQD